MSRFRKRAIVVEASQWFKNGDHPEDDCRELVGDDGPFLSEGRVVREFRRPDVPGIDLCEHCGRKMDDHGWIDTLEGGHIVCPADWIVTGVENERYPCKPGIFIKTYDPVPDDEVKEAEPAPVKMGVLCCVHGGSAAGDSFNTKGGLVCPQCYGEKLVPPEVCDRVAAALDFANRYGGTDGGHHKMWVIDQMIRALTGEGYEDWVAEFCAGDDGPHTYSWSVGLAP